MTLINWSTQYSVEVSEMDAEHQKLIGMINDLHDAMKTGQGKVAMSKILGELDDYTKTHFAHEEKLMEEVKYTGLVEQQMQHQKFISKIAEYKTKLESENIMTLEVMNFLKDWLVNHITVIDKKYSTYLK